MALINFSWVIPGELSGSAIPGGRVKASHAEIEADCIQMYNYGVRHIVSLEIMPSFFCDLCKKNGLILTNFSIDDFGVPRDLGGFENLVHTVLDEMKNSRPVCIHCRMGVGRTGMVLSCVVGRHFGINADLAIKTVRKGRRTLETEDQVSFVYRFLDTSFPLTD